MKEVSGNSSAGVSPSKGPRGHESSPNNLHKRAPSTTTRLPVIEAVVTTARAVPVLPPLVIDTELLTASTSSPSTALLLSAATHSNAPSFYERPWTADPASIDLAQPRRSASRRSSDTTESPTTIPSVGGRRRSTSIKRRDAVDRERDAGHSRPHLQSKGNGGKASSRRGSKKRPSQRDMLSKALQKANTAVLLDNAQNFQGAMEAYSEACNLLQEVMLRSSEDEDRRKLEAIVSRLTTSKTY